MSDVQIKVNTFNRIKKIRQGVVYGNIETVLDELLQNCQRTFKVSEIETPVIDVIVKGRHVIIRDNGKGCSDPQKIFEFERSGWDMKSAFGQGGSESVFQIADIIRISSLEWVALVDVNNVLDKENLNVNVWTTDDYLQGYEIMLEGKKIADNLTLIESYLKNTLAHFPYKCYLNGEKVEYIPLLKANSHFSLDFDNEFYSAKFGIQRGWKDCEVYYEKRKVTDVWIRGVTGIIELKDDAVTLKAPDRKSIIQDDKFYAFRKQYNDDAKELYQKYVASNPEAEAFDKYADYIDEYLQAEDYINYLPDFEALVKTPIPNKLDVTFDNTGSIVVETRHDLDKIVNVHKVSVDSKQYYPKFKDKQLVDSVWLENIRRDQLVELITKAMELDLKVYYSYNKLTQKAFRFLKIPHIEDVLKNETFSYVLHGTTKGDNTTYKEERLMNVLHYIEQCFELEDVFRIADVQEHIFVEHEERTLIDKLAKKSSATLKDRNKIYLDRKSLNLGKVNVSKSKSSVTKFDILVVMLNIQTIASGLAMLIYNTVEGTVDHFNKVEKISKEIGLLLASL